MASNLTLVSHHLCPYVQRAVIALDEKQVAFTRIDVDLSAKPDWFRRLSPLGKVPVLKADEHVIFESAVILEYLEETAPRPLHPANPERRAEHRSWIEFGSVILNDIAGLYNAPDAEAFETRRVSLAARFERVERHLGGSPWFDPGGFSLVDAVYGPVFRYFDTFEEIADLGVFDDTPKTVAWRRNLQERASVVAAVPSDYSQQLRRFLAERNSHLSALMAA